ncbi:hypothetical protein DPMN_184706 [Dreissena polymorpha]|uniref:Uncharacterized protein n=1 Tax=Dreissena polymorpha TaxID=45954 RepID=A0A9D4DLE0_DREPO|nr:hypothetical protein DPMN_184706 [Dreissena polymorpha]
MDGQTEGRTILTDGLTDSSSAICHPTGDIIIIIGVGNDEGIPERPIAGIDTDAPDMINTGNDPDIPGKVIPDMPKITPLSSVRKQRKSNSHGGTPDCKLLLMEQCYWRWVLIRRKKRVTCLGESEFARSFQSG